eukprot:13214-Prorocentrum_minimum.AAC.1
MNNSEAALKNYRWQSCAIVGNSGNAPLALASNPLAGNQCLPALIAKTLKPYEPCEPYEPYERYEPFRVNTWVLCETTVEEQPLLTCVLVPFLFRCFYWKIVVALTMNSGSKRTAWL